MSDAVIVLTTWPAARDADELAQTLVGERLAACVNVLGEMRSTYRWKDAVEVEHRAPADHQDDRPAAAGAAAAPLGAPPLRAA